MFLVCSNEKGTQPQAVAATAAALPSAGLEMHRFARLELGRTSDNAFYQ